MGKFRLNGLDRTTCAVADDDIYSATLASPFAYCVCRPSNVPGILDASASTSCAREGEAWGVLRQAEEPRLNADMSSYSSCAGASELTPSTYRNAVTIV